MWCGTLLHLSISHVVTLKFFLFSSFFEEKFTQILLHILTRLLGIFNSCSYFLGILEIYQIYGFLGTVFGDAQNGPVFDILS